MAFIQIKHFVNKMFRGNGRTSIVLKNVTISAIFKLLSILLSFIMVPITLEYLNKARYGLWAALSSVLAWFFIFDIGIGNGLRNKFIELKAKGRLSEIRNYISTTYFLFSVLAFIIIILFYFINYFIEWGELLNAPDDLNDELNNTAFIIFIMMTINFVVRLINTILQADLKNGLSDSFSVIAHVFTLIGIIVLSRLSKPSLLAYALLYTSSNLFVSIIASIILYNTIYRSISPRIRFIQLKLWKDLLAVGIKFFILQIASVILFQTTSFILSNLIGPESVADYNITSKYFSVSIMIFTMLSQPLWSGYGDAYYANDKIWITRTFRRLKKLGIGLFMLLILLIIGQKFVFSIWLNGRIQVDYFLSFLLLVYYTMQMWNSIFDPFINATGKLKISMISIYIIVPLFIPVTVIFVKYLGFGVYGIVTSMIILQGIPNCILLPIRSKKILNNESGIWNE